MLQPIRALANSVPERLRDGLGRRAAGFGAALAIEALLLALLFTLGQSRGPKRQPLVALTSFDARSEPKQPTPPKTPPKSTPRNPQTAPPVLQPPQPAPEPPKPAPTPPPLISLPRSQANFSLASLPQLPSPPAKAEAPFGPQDTGTPGDTKPVGTAPDGSPLYPARWYREPTNAELAAFGARAQAFGSSWGRIACKTAPDFRVEDCVEVDEYPQNSHLAHAVLSAAWQFKVRPPWHAGHSLIGSWVQITIYNDVKLPGYKGVKSY